MRLNRAAAILIAGILFIGLTGCSDDTPKPSTEAAPTAPTSSATQTPEPTATPTPVTDEDKAAAALLGYLEIRDEMYRTLRYPKDFRKYATNDVSFSRQRELVTLRAIGGTYRGEWGHEVIAVNKDKLAGLVVADCEDRTSLDARLPDGKPIRTMMANGRFQPIRSRIDYRVVREGDRWVVDSETTGTFPPC